MKHPSSQIRDRYPRHATTPIPTQPENDLQTNGLSAIKRTMIGAAAAFIVGATLGFTTAAQGEPAADYEPQWTADGELVLPRDFRTWVFLGAPLTPNALNDGNAGFPEFHNVYVQPHAYRAYRETGTFPEGTILVKELQLTVAGDDPNGSRLEASGRGYFPGNRNGIDISVKDSRQFKETNGWGFFNFGHHAPPYAETAPAAPKDACAGCHIANATDMVFTKFYLPILQAE